MERISDEYMVNLWVSFKKGDRDSFEKIFQQYYSLLISYGRKFTTDRYLIEESAQDLFLKLWNNRYTLSVPASVKPYILKSFRSVLFRKLQKMSVSTLEQLDEGRYTFCLEVAHDQKVIDDEKEKEKKNKIEISLRKLTSRQREAVYLRFYQDLTYEEIAEVLHIEIGGTYKLLYRALERLKEELGPVVLAYLLLSIAP